MPATMWMDVCEHKWKQYNIASLIETQTLWMKLTSFFKWFPPFSSVSFCHTVVEVHFLIQFFVCSFCSHWRFILLCCFVFLTVSGVQSLSSSVQSTPEKHGHSDDASRSPELLQEFLKSGPKKELLRSCFTKEKKHSASSKCKMAEQVVKTSNKTFKNQDARKVSSSPNNQSTSRKHHRKGENPIRLPLATEQSPDFVCSNSWVCKNSACRAVLSIEDTFCKRCSCCICHRFDDNKDPSLWLVCTSESSHEDSCGLSCHIDCALLRNKVGVVDLGQLMQLDGSYCCATCGKVSGILG